MDDYADRDLIADDDTIRKILGENHKNMAHNTLTGILRYIKQKQSSNALQERATQEGFHIDSVKKLLSAYM